MEIEKLYVPSEDKIKDAIITLCMACHHSAWNNGWWHDLETGEKKKRPVPEIMTLLHSEISEGFEGFRKNLNDDHLPQYPMIAVEMADLGIRLFDFAGHGMPDTIEGYKTTIAAFANAWYDKMQYNNNREDHKPENRLKAGGKKI